MPTRFSSALLLVLVAGQGAWGAPPSVISVMSSRSSRSIAQCHGVDAADRKGGLRLDLRESALKGGDSGAAAIVPGKPDESEMIRRITSDDPDRADAAAEA